MIDWMTDQKLTGSQFSLPHESNQNDNEKKTKTKQKAQLSQKYRATLCDCVM